MPDEPQQQEPETVEVNMPGLTIQIGGADIDVVPAPQPGARAMVIGPIMLHIVLPLQDDSADQLGEALQKPLIVRAPGNALAQLVGPDGKSVLQ